MLQCPVEVKGTDYELVSTVSDVVSVATGAQENVVLKSIQVPSAGNYVVKTFIWREGLQPVDLPGILE